MAWFGEQPLLGTRLSVSALTKEQKAVELQRVVAARAMAAAYEAELVMGLADDTPTPSTRHRTTPARRRDPGRRMPSCPGV